MTFGPLPTTPIADRLRLVDAFVAVGEAADIGAVMIAQQPTPCAFVLLGSESGGKRMGGSVAYRQRNSAVVGVLIGVRIYGDETGGVASPDLADLIGKTRTTLLAFAPPGADTVLEFVDGRVLSMDEGGAVWWLDRYRCDYWLTT